MIFCVILTIVTAYLLGSIPSAYYAGKWAKGIDLRTVGSGNLGFTNAFRNLGAAWSLPVLAFDILKGVAVVQIARWLVPNTEWLPILSGLVAILGHNWTIFLGFKGGGKGVACSAGVFLALTPLSFVITLLVFLLTLYFTRYVSLGSILGAATLMIAGSILTLVKSSHAPSTEVLWFSFIIGLLVIFRHTSNMKRLLDGTEHKFGEKRKEA